MYTTCPLCKHNPVAPGATLCPDCESARPALLTLTRCPACKFYYMVAGDAMCANCLTNAPTVILATSEKPQDIPFEDEHVCSYCGRYDEAVTADLPFCLGCLADLNCQFGHLQGYIQQGRLNEFTYAHTDEPYGLLQTHTCCETGPCWCPRGIPLSEVLK